MPNLASVKIIVAYFLDLVWSSPARTITPRLSKRLKVSPSVIVCMLSLKATHFEHIWGQQEKLMALGHAITKLEVVIWK